MNTKSKFVVVLRKINTFLAVKGFFDFLPDTVFLKMRYKLCIGRPLNLNEPKTFNEKIQWLKIYNRDPLYTVMADKVLVKKYVSDIIGEEFVIPTLGVWDSVEDIDFDSLPNQFVLNAIMIRLGLLYVKINRYWINLAQKSV